MIEFEISPVQKQIIAEPIQGASFLEGPAGTGKTTAAFLRMQRMIREGILPATILLVTPQRSLAEPYLDAVNSADLAQPGLIEHLTLNGLAQRMVDLFWPVAAEKAGFNHPDLPPVFLTMETAQFYMASLARPFIEEGYFESVVMDRNRLYSQVLDNLNKSVLVGFPIDELGDRLASTWIGEPGQKRIYLQAQELALCFRKFCLENNLLDFSLQVEIFRKHLWSMELCRNYLRSRYHHLIFDNVEEDTPLTHDIIEEWLPHFDSSMLIYDTQAGYRIFLGADPENAYRLKDVCERKIVFEDNLVNSAPMAGLLEDFTAALGRQSIPRKDVSVSSLEPVPIKPPALHVSTERRLRYHSQMLDWVTEQVTCLVKTDGIRPGEIAILSPYLSDALRFGLVNRLEAAGIPAHSYRPSRGLRDEPAVRCLLTLAQLAHPAWGSFPSKQDLTNCLVQAIDGLDLVRAQLLVEVLYSVRKQTATLASFHQVRPEMRERITYSAGERYELLRDWLANYAAGAPVHLDHFFSRLFGEILSQKGFGFHQALDSGGAASRLVESARKFRFVTGETMRRTGWSVSHEFVRMVQEGVISSQYQPQSWADEGNAVLLAPAFSFLMRNRAVDVQFWLDVGGLGWWERLNQPLTQPYVLTRSWPADRPWTDADEFQANQEMLARLTSGLLRRCRQQLFLGMSDLSVQGYDQQGPLLQVIQKVLRNQTQSRLAPGLSYV